MKQQVPFLLNKALEYLRSSNLDSAELFLKQALKIDSKSPEVLRLLGVVAAQRRQYLMALDYFNKSLTEYPKNPLTLGNLGNIFLELKEYEKAGEAYDKSLKLDSKNEEIWSNKGNLLCKLKRYQEAIQHHDKALSLNPAYAEAISNKGNALFELKDFAEAIQTYDQALKIKPFLADIWFNRGNALFELNLNEDAAYSYENGLKLKPSHAIGWSDMGNALRALGQYEEADAHYAKAIELKPEFAEGWLNKANTLGELKNYSESILHFKKALNIKPDLDWAKGYLLNVKMEIADWSNFNDNLDEMVQNINQDKKIAQPFGLLSILDDPALCKKATEIYVESNYSIKRTLNFPRKKLNNRKIRIGYFSADFRTHVVAFITAQLFALHDKNKFEIYAFSFFNPLEVDLMHLKLRRTFDSFIDCQSLSDFDVAQKSRELEIDIAIDMGGYTQFSRPKVFHHRAAPIQVNWLGYPGTLGSTNCDYIIADHIIIPESNQIFFTEKVAYLPNSYMVDDDSRKKSMKKFNKADYGLPEDKFIFCSFNNSYKFNPNVLHSWSKILINKENSILWIPENNKQFMLNIQKEFLKRGVKEERIIFAKREESMADHLSRIGLADLFLDTYPFNAHSTGLDSLKAGVPILTLIGNSFASRVAASLLNAVNMPELITSSQEEYEALAIDLATNPEKLYAIKQKLAKNLVSEPLFDTPLFTRNIEALYIKMYQRYHDGLSPDHLSLN
jgi:protein O-GlcNAc transferase